MTVKPTLADDEIKLEVLRLSNEGLTLSQIQEYTGIPRSTLGYFLSGKRYQDWWANYADKPVAAGELHDHYKSIKQLKGSRYILTSAQNNTYVHRQFLKSLEKMAEHLDAQLIVGTFTYNKNAFQNLEKNSSDIWYDPLIKDYILDEPAMLAKGLVWCGELNILPTAVNPLSGLQSYTRNSSGIIPHAKMQMESIPTHKMHETRFLYTTGTVTKRNYIQKKSGQKASFHHIFGALLVEVDSDGDWFVRQIHADEGTGEFYDLDKLYTPDGVEENQRVEAINWGDIHIEKLDDCVAEASFFAEDSMLNVLRPKFQFMHDILDFEARNHHNIHDPYFRFRMYYEGRELVEENINKLTTFLKNIDRSDTKTVVVESNHDLALRRWLKEADYKTDPANAVFYLTCQLEIYKNMQAGNYGFNLLQWLSKQHVSDNVLFLDTDQSFRICDEDGMGIECGSHGHLGNNGARGSINSYTKLEARYNIGHSHSAAIKDGVYVAGICADFAKMDYAKGASSWSHSHIVTYQNGRRAIVTLKNGKWRA